MNLVQIGTIHTPFKESKDTPIQPSASDAQGYIELDEQYLDGLKDLDGFDRIWLLFWCNRAKEPKMLVTPYMDTEQHGLFAIRAPSRPNPIGMSSVALDRIEGNRIYISQIDILDNTPLLDIKPYVTGFDSYPGVRNGWLDRRHKNELKRGKADSRFEGK